MQIDFYILERGNHAKSLLFACQQLEKNFLDQERVYVQLSSFDEAERFDKLLWTFRDDSFLPHHLAQQIIDYAAPIVIGCNDTPKAEFDVLMNLGPHVPAFYTQFKRVIEIVFPDPSVQQLARERYKYYRDQKLEIKTHKIASV